MQEETINCREGIAYISFISHLVMAYGSLENGSLLILSPKSKVLNICDHEYGISVDELWLTMDNISDWKTECELIAEIISSNSLFLRLYVKDRKQDDFNYVPFLITANCLINIARMTFDM